MLVAVLDLWQKLLFSLRSRVSELTDRTTLNRGRYILACKHSGDLAD